MKAIARRAAFCSAAAMIGLSFADATAADNRKPTITERQMYGYVGDEASLLLSRSALQRLDTRAGAHEKKDSVRRVAFWHKALLDAIAVDLTADPSTGAPPADQVGPTRASRALAMTQIAVFDAVNAFEQRYNAYNDIGEAPANASMNAAIAYAAHDVLVALYPGQKKRIDELLAADLMTLSEPRSAISRGRRIGKASASAIMMRRAADNSFDPEPDYGEGGRIASDSSTHYGTPVNGGTALMYEWTPDPLTPNPSTPSGVNELALGAYWGGVTPFALTSGNQFRAPPPPPPGSAAYVAAYNEVAAVGGSPDNTGTQSVSTPQTRFIGNYWGYDGVPRLGTPPRLFAQIAVQVAMDKGVRNAADLARFLAMVHVALADAAIAAWDSKYYYNYWRPVTAIRRGDSVPSTATDAGWSPVGVSVINTTVPIRATPPFPAYPSGHATFGAATFEIMRRFYGHRTPFTFVSEEYDGNGVDPFGTPRPLVPVRFDSFTEAQFENGLSRIYNGVHWSYDNTQGQAIGVKVGRHVLDGIEPFRKKKAK